MFGDCLDGWRNLTSRRVSRQFRVDDVQSFQDSNLAEPLVGTHEMVDWGGSVEVKGNGELDGIQGTELTDFNPYLPMSSPATSKESKKWRSIRELLGPHVRQ